MEGEWGKREEGIGETTKEEEKKTYLPLSPRLVSHPTSSPRPPLLRAQFISFVCCNFPVLAGGEKEIPEWMG